MLPESPGLGFGEREAFWGRGGRMKGKMQRVR